LFVKIHKARATVLEPETRIVIDEKFIGSNWQNQPKFRMNGAAWLRIACCTDPTICER
jgi:hypothetical protein